MILLFESDYSCMITYYNSFVFR